MTNNPEKAADLAAKVFKVQLGDNADKWKTHFISAENKRRRTSEQQEKEREAFEAEKAEVRKVADDTLAAVQPILDIVEAEQKSDFPAIDLFIETTFGMSFNEYCAKRLRGNSKESTAERAAKLKAEKLEKELADLKAGKKAEPEKKEASERPTVSAKWIDKGVPEDHDVRELADWGKRVQEAYADSYDEETEDYTLSVEEAADKVYKSWLKKRMPAAEETPKPKPKPKAKPKAKREDDDEEERTPAADVDAYQADYQERVRLALKRAESRR